MDFDIDIIAKKSIRGIFALVSRTLFVQVLAFVANLILTIVLEPRIFGIYFIASSIIIFFNAFQDIGLAASLIQKKEEPTVKELQTVFTVQQVLVLILIIPALIFSASITRFYNLDADGHVLFVALLISFFFSSLRSIPTAIMERSLDFKKYVVPQIGESLIYYVSLTVLALLGQGIRSFTIAILLRGITGLILTYKVQSWPIGISFDFTIFKKVASFGLPFQSNTILALIKDDLLNIYIGKILPFAQVGYIGFAQRWAFYPLRLIMDNVIKITFPSYSRLQHDKQGLKLAIEKSLFLISFFIFPTAVGIILFSPFLVQYMPRYQKWEPALLSLTFFSLNTIFSSIATPLTNFLNAIGKVKITFYFMIFWTAITWLLTPICITFFGFNGVAFASFVISITSIFVFIIARKDVEFSFIKPVGKQMIAAFCMFVFILVTRNVISSFFMLLIEIALSGLLYLFIVTILHKGELTKTVRFIIHSVREEV